MSEVYQKSANRNPAGRKGTHRLTRAPEYINWVEMRRRCNAIPVEGHTEYVTRGLSICESWNDFTVFLADMGRKPSSAHTIDRINNEMGYSPSNCRWATVTEQNRNKRGLRWIEYRGETKLLVDWARIAGVNPVTFSARIGRYGWTMERAMNTKPKEATP